jgi:hypothetical protein
MELMGEDRTVQTSAGVGRCASPARAAANLRPAAAGDLSPVLERILARLISIEGLLRSRPAGASPRRIVSSTSGAAAPHRVPTVGTPPAPVAVPLEHLSLKEEAPPRRNRRHTPESIRRDRAKLEGWLAALGMNPASAAAAADIHAADLHCTLREKTGLSAHVEAAMEELVRGRGLTSGSEGGQPPAADDVQFPARLIG